MPDNPISNPGTSPVSPTPEYGRDKPRLGEDEEANPTKPFALPPENGAKAGSKIVESDRPTPMEAAKESIVKQDVTQTQEQIQDKLQQVKGSLEKVQNDLVNPDITNKFVQDHYDALNKTADVMGRDLNNIAKNSSEDGKGEFSAPQRIAGEPALNYITKFLNGAQETLNSALNSIGNQKNPNPAAMLKLQFSVQRAAQHAELFASIVGSSVSGIKTIMSTQLG